MPFLLMFLLPLICHLRLNRSCSYFALMASGRRHHLSHTKNEAQSIRKIFDCSESLQSCDLPFHQSWRFLAFFSIYGKHADGSGLFFRAYAQQLIEFSVASRQLCAAGTNVWEAVSVEKKYSGSQPFDMHGPMYIIQNFCGLGEGVG